MHHQDWHIDFLQIFGEVRLGEGDDAVIVCLAPLFDWPITKWGGGILEKR